MMTNLMTISVEMVSTSSKLATVYLSCPPPGGLFSIYQNASYGLSYKVNKGRKADFSSLSPIIIIEESNLQTFLHTRGEKKPVHKVVMTEKRSLPT